MEYILDNLKIIFSMESVYKIVSKEFGIKDNQKAIIQSLIHSTCCQKYLKNYLNHHKEYRTKRTGKTFSKDGTNYKFLISFKPSSKK